MTHEYVRLFLTPSLRDEVINQSVTADTSIFENDITAIDEGYWVIQITTDTAGYPKLVLTPAGASTAVTTALNSAVELTTDCLYEFWLAAETGDQINLQFSANATVTIRIFFIRAG